MHANHSWGGGASPPLLFFSLLFTLAFNPSAHVGTGGNAIIKSRRRVGEQTQAAHGCRRNPQRAAKIPLLLFILDTPQTSG